MKNTYRYEITERNGAFHAMEADGPSAPATGEYSTLAEAQAAIQRLADKAGITDLDWDADEFEGTQYWVAEWEARR